MKFEDLKFNQMEGYSKGSIQAKVEFPNGYGASVIRNEFSYGGGEGLYELAVTFKGMLCYSTHITNDVIGHLTPEEINPLLEAIEAL